MSIAFEKHEIISLILNFCTDSKGYWKKTLSEHPEATKFIDLGYAELNNKNEKYILNDDGINEINGYLSCITKAFIDFMKQSNGECAFSSIEQWYISIYKLKNPEMAERIREYVYDNAHRFGYNIAQMHPHGSSEMWYTLNT